MSSLKNKFLDLYNSNCSGIADIHRKSKEHDFTVKKNKNQRNVAKSKYLFFTPSSLSYILKKTSLHSYHRWPGASRFGWYEAA